MIQNPLYEQAYPDLLGAFGAYVEMRYIDKFPRLYGGLKVPNIRDFMSFHDSKNPTYGNSFATYLEYNFTNSLQHLWKEFYFLSYPKSDEAFGGGTRSDIDGIEELTTKYGNFVRHPYLADIRTLSTSYIQMGYSKLTYPRIPHISERSHPGGNTYSRGQLGLDTGVSTEIWSTILHGALGKDFNLNHFILRVANVDLDNIEEARHGIGVLPNTLGEKVRDWDLLDLNNKSGLVSDIPARYQKAGTYGCPAGKDPSPMLKSVINEFYPDLKVRSLISVVQDEAACVTKEWLVELRKPEIMKKLEEGGFFRDDEMMLLKREYPGEVGGGVEGQ